jgi:putative ABC transport system substrate-binding protein
MANHSDPAGSGLVVSLARPGRNVTGLSLLTTELVGKRLQLLKEAVPGISRVAVLLDPTHPTAALQLREADVAARSLKVQLHVLEARAPSDFAAAFSAMTKDRAGGLIVLGTLMFFVQRTRIVELAAQSRLPAIYGAKESAEAGGLMAYGPNLRESYRRAATYVDKILKGAKPGDLPIEQPAKFEFVVNMKTAKALGLTIPPSLLLRADQVIE